MGHGIKTEHNGAKKGGGYWGRRVQAKEHCNSLRRAEDKVAVTDWVREDHYDHAHQEAGKSKRKDKRRWCKGKEGREHKTECRARQCWWLEPTRGKVSAHPTWRELVCTDCGKVVDWCYSNRGKGKKSWVTF